MWRSQCPNSKLQMILHSYVEKVVTMCSLQEWHFSLSYFPGYFPLIFQAAISCPLLSLNTVSSTLIRLHSYVEQVVTMCHV